MSSVSSPGVCAPPKAPGGFPLVGNALSLRFRPLEFFESLRDHGDVVAFRIGRRTAYFINSPHLVREVLTTKYGSFGKGGPLWDTARKVLGDGLVTSNGDKHRRQRRLMQPAFHRARVAEYAAIMSEEAAAAADSWRDGQPLDLPHEMTKLTMMTATRTLFSAESSSDAASEIQRAFRVLADGAGKRTRTPIEILYKLPLPANRRFTRETRRFNQLVDRIIAEYRTAGTPRGDLLSMLLAARDEETGQAMSDAQIHDECTTILAGGTETTACTLSWLWYVLSCRPDVEERVHAEVDTVLAGRPAGYEDFAKLQYVQRVVNETLRMYPPLWLTTRTANTQVDLGGYRIPAGAYVFISPYVMQRNPTVYPDPDRLDPDRWLPDRYGTAQRDSFLSFGGGVRQCIGSMFGLVESVIMISTLAGRWRLRMAAGQKTRPVAEATLVPSSLTVIAERRDR